MEYAGQISNNILKQTNVNLLFVKDLKQYKGKIVRLKWDLDRTDFFQQPTNFDTHYPATTKS